MRGIIINYHIAYTKEVLVKIQGITSKKTGSKLIGKKTVWKDEHGKEWHGKISGVHGSSGTLKVKFKHQLPSKCLAKPIDIVD
jgi:ribosomal protein L35AE/L33A